MSEVPVSGHPVWETLEEVIRERDALRAELDRVQRLPELEWSRVTSIIMQVAGSIARLDGDTASAKAIRDALDLGSTYVGRLRGERDALRDFLESEFRGDDGFGEAFDELLRLGFLVEVEPTPEFIDEWGEDQRAYNWAWNVTREEESDA